MALLRHSDAQLMACSTTMSSPANRHHAVPCINVDVSCMPGKVNKTKCKVVLLSNVDIPSVKLNSKAVSESPYVFTKALQFPLLYHYLQDIARKKCCCYSLSMDSDLDIVLGTAVASLS